MSITYRTAGAWGAGIGMNLTAHQVDLNFYDLDTRVVTLEASLPGSLNEITNITQAGAIFSIFTTDGTEYDITLPTVVSTYAPAATGTVAGDIYTPALPQANTYTRFTTDSTGGCVITVPDEAEVDFPIDTEMHFRQAGDGGLMFVEGSTDVLINPIDGFENATNRKGAVVTLKKIGSNEWDIHGLLMAASA